MHDELPDPFDKLPTAAAPSELRARVLAAVDTELKRRVKPRWERILERSVAAAFLLGVGLNADVFVNGARGIASLRAQRALEVGQDLPLAHEANEPRSRSLDVAFPWASRFNDDYAKLLARLSEPSDG